MSTVYAGTHETWQYDLLDTHELMKALGGVDFTKYVLSVIVQTSYCKNYKVA